jgi:YD repeat-containing protein
MDTSPSNPLIEQCNWLDSYLFYDTSGAPHALDLILSQRQTDSQGICPASTGTTVTGGDVYYSATTTNNVAGLQGGTTAQVADADGTVYSFPSFNNFTYEGGGTSSTTIYSTIAPSIEDRNGNEITFSNGAYTDTLKRTLLSYTTSGGTLGTGGVTTVTDNFAVAGISKPYIVTWVTSPAIGSVKGSYQLSSTLVSTADPYCTPGESFNSLTPQNYITSIELPNGDTYQFSYDPTFGTLKTITYPSGLIILYDWGVIPRLMQQNFSLSRTVGGDDQEYVYTDYCPYYYDAVAITGRHVIQGSSEILTQSFSYTPASTFGGNTTTTVTTLDDVTNVSTTTVTSYSKAVAYANEFVPPPQYSNSMPLVVNPGIGTEYSPGFLSLESSESVKDYSGALLQTTNKSWYTGATWNELYLLQSAQNTLGSSGPSSQVDYCYGQGGVVTEKDEYDYLSTLPTTPACPQTVSPTPTRRTATVYQQLGATKVYPTAKTIFDRPEYVYTYDSSKTEAAETDYYYDGSDTSGVSATQHDEGNYGPGAPGVRGNATSVTHKCFGGSTGCSDSTAIYTYDETGQIASIMDPRGNTTQYSFMDNPSGGNVPGNSNAYLTKIIDPQGHTEQFTYNYPTSELASSIDENNQTTTYGYADSLLRLTDIYGPPYNNGQPHTHYAYVDGTAPSVTSTNPVGVTSASYFDGKGHVIETQLTTDPAGADTVLTTYDGEGRIYTKTNPFRGTTAPAGTTTTYYYDAVGRPVETLEQNGNKLQWCYNDAASYPSSLLPIQNCSVHLGSAPIGSWVDSTDENGNHWQRTSDSFGRLTEVMEPNGSSQVPTMETDYIYNALNDLTSVTQWGGASGSAGKRGRSFIYNSLSQLQSATNPETGTVGYAYDVNGNVQSRTDARGVTTTYSYDQLNRLLSKTYSNDLNGTPLSCFLYNLSTLGVGRLTSAWTQSASATTSCSTSAAFLTKRTIVAYDPMGRIVSEQQYTPASQASGTFYSPQYTYDLAGNLTSSTDGVTPSPTTPGTFLTFTYCYDGAGRLQLLSSNWIDPTHPQWLFIAQSIPCSTTSSPTLSSTPYTAFGALMNAEYGSGLTLNRAYDQRLRMTGEIDTGSIVAVPTSGNAAVTITGVEQSK